MDKKRQESLHHLNETYFKRRDSGPAKYILIQTGKRITESQSKALKAHGVEPLEYFHENTYLCYDRGRDPERLLKLGFVKWANPFLPHFKIPSYFFHPYTNEEISLLDVNEHIQKHSLTKLHGPLIFSPQLKASRLTAQEIQGFLTKTLKQKLKELELPAHEVQFSRIAVPPGLTSLEIIFEEILLLELVFLLEILDGVQRIDCSIVPGLMDYDDDPPALQIINAAKPQELGWDGHGQLVAVCDSGFDRGLERDTFSLQEPLHPAFRKRDGGFRVRELIPLYDTLGNGADTLDHGTQVAGCVAADGKAHGSGRIRGSAPGAELYIQALRADDASNSGLEFDMTPIYQAAYQAGARVHTNSWGDVFFLFFGFIFIDGIPFPFPEWTAPSDGRYTYHSFQTDNFVWNNRDFVICFAAGNHGRGVPSAGNVLKTDLKEGTVTAPGTAKNCICVGASEGLNPRLDRTYGMNTFGTLFKNPIFRNDLVADKPCGLAPFSGRGPVGNSLRIKPDLVAPGTSIISSRSTVALKSRRWGTSHDRYYGYGGGTSRSTPLVAGCAAVVRQFLIAKRKQPPSAALVKAMLINGADAIPGQYNLDPKLPNPNPRTEAGPVPNPGDGFGRVNLGATVEADGSEWLLIRDEHENPALDDKKSMPKLTVPSPATVSDIKVTLVWTDPPADSLQNNLDLKVTIGGHFYYGNNPVLDDGTTDKVNNVEQVLWPGVPAGSNVDIVVSHEGLMPKGSPNVLQTFALVVRTVK
jgi:hypothetical protein